MAAVRSRENKSTELRLTSLFRKAKISGWRRHQKVSGNPDFIFRRGKIAVFVDGCFWHGCTAHRSIPKTNRAFWKKKIERNVARDRDTNKMLRKDGWTVIRVWEHELKKVENVPQKILLALARM